MAALRSVPVIHVQSRVAGLTTILDGPLGTFSAGALRGAAGAEFRNQTFAAQWSDELTPSMTVDHYSRRLVAVFTEFRATLGGANNAPAGLKRLDLSASARVESYSDFGWAFTPRWGLKWTLEKGFEITASLGKSFRVPDPGNLDQGKNSVILASVIDPASASGLSNVLELFGNNSDLTQERALSRNVGFHVTESVSSQITLESTFDYFSARFAERIQLPAYTDEPLTNAAVNYLVIRNPNGNQIGAACAAGHYFTPASSCQASGPTAIVDFRLQNFETLTVSGIDLDTTLQGTPSWGRWAWKINGTYLLDYSEVAQPHDPNLSLLATQSNPAALRLRSSMDIVVRDFDLLGTVNYSSQYRDTLSQPIRRVGSWTTLDALLTWTPDRTRTAASGVTELSIGVKNLLNRYPPFLTNYADLVGYDPENASPLLRTASVQLHRQW